MGRIFETRKHVMFARWDRMAKAFTRIGKEIAIAVRAGGPIPENNPALRRVIQNAKAVNMPKDRIAAAIKKASGEGAADAIQEVFYEGYAAHGVAVIVETATDNPTRTVANVRALFVRGGGSLASNGSVSFMFKRMGVFRLKPEGLDAESMELDLIDHGLEEMGETASDKGEPQVLIRCAYADFGRMQKALEERGITPVSADLEFVAQTPTVLPEDKATEVLQLVDKLEQDDDVQRVFHNLV